MLRAAHQRFAASQLHRRQFEAFLQGEVAVGKPQRIDGKLSFRSDWQTSEERNVTVAEEIEILLLGQPRDVAQHAGHLRTEIGGHHRGEIGVG